MKNMKTVGIIDIGPAYKPLIKMPVSDLDRGQFETSAQLVGNYRTSWIMKLTREPSACKLPRGFGRLSGKNV
jgi:hypothetical protein